MTDERRRVVRRAYDRMAERYVAWSATIDDVARARMVAEFATRLPSGVRVLDLGCGAGVPSTRDLATRFSVLGVDASPRQIELARQNVPHAEFRVADMAELHFAEGCFDGVAALYSISHLPREQHADLFGRIQRWLTPGGLFLATLGATDSPDWSGPWLGEEMFFSGHDADQNRALLRSAGFELDVDEVAVTPEPEGDVSFLWVIARNARSRAWVTPASRSVASTMRY